MGGTYLGDVRHDGKLEFVTVLAEQPLEMCFLRLRPEGGSDGVTFLEEGIHDVDGGEAIRARDEDFAPWSDGWHVLYLLGVWVRARVRFGDVGDVLGKGTREKSPSLFIPQDLPPRPDSTEAYDDAIHPVDHPCDSPCGWMTNHFKGGAYILGFKDISKDFRGSGNLRTRVRAPNRSREVSPRSE